MKLPHKLTQAYYERECYKMKLETRFYRVNMHKHLHTCKIKECIIILQLSMQLRVPKLSILYYTLYIEAMLRVTSFLQATM